MGVGGIVEQENIQKFIKNLRKEKNLTQKQLADLLGVTYQAVSKWERGLNIPDLSILQEMSRLFDVDIDTIINGKKKSDGKKKRPFYILFCLSFLFLLIFCFCLFGRNHDFTLKKVSSDCEDFTLNGSVAYNQDKSAIYISNIDYCGDEKEIIYQRIECNLYEEYKDSRKLVHTISAKKNTSLSSYLKTLEVHVENYQSSCRMFSSSKLYLEIKAIDSNGQVHLYQVPLKLEENCD